MNTTDSAKVSDANAGANNVIHIPHNPTLAGLATLTRNVAYKTGADNLVMDIISPQSAATPPWYSCKAAPGPRRIATTRFRSSRLWPAKALWWLR